MGLADLHMHTIYSYDGTATVPAVLKRAKRNGLDVIAITDHDEIRGALEALDLAAQVGIEVIPGIEITTAEGDLLGLFITKKVPAGLSLLETVLRVGALGGVCIAPHPMAGGMGMKSLSAYSIRQALKHPEAAQILIGIETYNATALDRESCESAEILANWLGKTATGSSDAHILDAIGLGATEFPGQSAADLRAALIKGATTVRKQSHWSPARILGGWALNYLLSTPGRLNPIGQVFTAQRAYGEG